MEDQQQLVEIKVDDADVVVDLEVDGHRVCGVALSLLYVARVDCVVLQKYACCVLMGLQQQDVCWSDEIIFSDELIVNAKFFVFIDFVEAVCDAVWLADDALCIYYGQWLEC